jgi:hypothetical protein
MKNPLLIITGKRVAQIFFTLSLAFVAVSAVAFAQTAFTEPTTAAPGGNISPPVTAGNKFQVKAGNVSATAVGSTNGYAVLSGGSTASVWDAEYSTTLVSSSQFGTIKVGQLCIGGNCISSLGSIAPTVDIYLNGASCGAACVGNLLTETQICVDNGYSHVVNAMGGGNGNNGLCQWTGTAWSCNNSCSSSCGSSALQRVTCDDNS